MDLKNKIEAKDISISNLLKGQNSQLIISSMNIRWQEKHIKLLIEDLTAVKICSYYM